MLNLCHCHARPHAPHGYTPRSPDGKPVTVARSQTEDRLRQDIAQSGHRLVDLGTRNRQRRTKSHVGLTAGKHNDPV